MAILLALVLRVCADPNNLPFSNRAGEGLENAMARLVAGQLGAELHYMWLPQRRGFVRNTMGADRCDVMMEVPAGYPRTLATRPWYRSSYVFVYRKDRGLTLKSFDDPALRSLRIGVQVIGDDYANTPPAHALGKRGLSKDVVGFPVYGDYSKPGPLSPIIDAVANGEVDVAIVWGPIAGWFAQRAATPLAIVPVSPATDGPFPFTFDIAIGVKRGQEALRDKLDVTLERLRPQIDAILTRYSIPRVP
jgi:quinoprotein dehydrogenase-associated probable ABC transporter substrate-binding protein